MSRITSIEQLTEIYGEPAESSLVKESSTITVEYRALIAASPFVALATVGPEGLDCSPRGDRASFVHVANERTLMIPDRRGNNRVDSLRNILRDARVALLFLIPGVGTTLRVNGRAHLSTADADLERFAVEGNAPRSVVVIEVNVVYFQCARAIVRSELWNPAKHVDAGSLPTPGQMLSTLSHGKHGGREYDAGWSERARKTLW